MAEIDFDLKSAIFDGTDVGRRQGGLYQSGYRTQVGKDIVAALMEHVSYNTDHIVGKVQFEPYVAFPRTFPRHVWVTHLPFLRSAIPLYVTGICIAKMIATGIIKYIRQVKEPLTTDLVVAYLSVRPPDFQKAYQPILRHKRFFGNHPAQRKRREEAVTFVFGKILRTIVSHIHLGEIPSGVAICGAGHGADIAHWHSVSIRRIMGLLPHV